MSIYERLYNKEHKFGKIERKYAYMKKITFSSLKFIPILSRIIVLLIIYLAMFKKIVYVDTILFVIYILFGYISFILFILGYEKYIDKKVEKTIITKNDIDELYKMKINDRYKSFIEYITYTKEEITLKDIIDGYDKIK